MTASDWKPARYPDNPVEIVYVCEAAGAYRRLLTALLLQHLLAICVWSRPSWFTRPDTEMPSSLGYTTLGAIVVVGVYALRISYKLARWTSLSAPRIWSAGVLSPGPSLAVLVVLAGRMRRLFATYDIRAGVLGPSRESVDAFRGAACERLLQELKQGRT